MTDSPLVICRRCGFGNVPGDQFCGSCGAFLEWEGERAGGAPATPGATPPTAPAGDSAWPPIPADPVAPDAPAPAPAPVPTPAPGQGGWGVARPAPTPAQAPLDAGLVRCPACGVANPATRTFCQSCGTTLAAASRLAEPSADDIAAAIAAVPGSSSTTPVPPTPPRAARAGAAAKSGGIGRWVIVMALAGVAVGVVVVGAGTLLRGEGPASGASNAPGSGPLASSTGGGSSAGPGGSGAPGPSVVPPAAGPLSLTGAAASSVVGNRAKFQPEKAIDGDLGTAWQEGSATEKGQWIEVTFAASRVDKLVIRNGYQASTALYKGNMRLKDVLISVNGGTGVPARLKDTTKAQTIDLGELSGATSVRITIVSTYPASKTSVAGTPFDDAAVSEIRVIGVPGG